MSLSYWLKRYTYNKHREKDSKALDSKFFCHNGTSKVVRFLLHLNTFVTTITGTADLFDFLDGYVYDLISIDE